MRGRGDYVPPPYIPLEQSDVEAGTAPMNTEPPPRHQITRDPTQWSSGICACFDDMPSCMVVWAFSARASFWKNAEFLGSGTFTGSCVTHFILWGLVNGLCCLLTEGILLGLPGSIVSCYACGYRRALRAKYNLQEAPCGDLATHLFCHLCAICQEYREIRERMDSSNQSDRQTLVQAPPVQTMEPASQE